MGLDTLYGIYRQQRRHLLRLARRTGARFPSRVCAEAFVCLYEQRATIADADDARDFLRRQVCTAQPTRPWWARNLLFQAVSKSA